MLSMPWAPLKPDSSRIDHRAFSGNLARAASEVLSRPLGVSDDLFRPHRSAHDFPYEPEGVVHHAVEAPDLPVRKKHDGNGQLSLQGLHSGRLRLRDEDELRLHAEHSLQVRVLVYICRSSRPDHRQARERLVGVPVRPACRKVLLHPFYTRELALHTEVDDETKTPGPRQMIRSGRDGTCTERPAMS